MDALTVNRQIEVHRCPNLVGKQTPLIKGGNEKGERGRKLSVSLSVRPELKLSLALL